MWIETKVKAAHAVLSQNFREVRALLVRFREVLSPRVVYPQFDLYELALVEHSDASDFSALRKVVGDELKDDRVPNSIGRVLVDSDLCRELPSVFVHLVLPRRDDPGLEQSEGRHFLLAAFDVVVVNVRLPVDRVGEEVISYPSEGSANTSHLKSSHLNFRQNVNSKAKYLSRF